jgi:hypothetical protein
MAKKIDPKAKAKRQKIMVAVGGVLLLGLLAFQVPRTLKMLNPPTADNGSSSSATSPTGGTTAPITPPSLGGSNATPASSNTSAGGLNDPDGLPAPQSGQLLVFGRFRSKDPFVQQIKICSSTDESCSTSTSSGSTTSSTSAGAAAAGAATTPPAQSPSGGGSAGSTPKSSAPAKKTSAKISVNGVPETVSAGAQFPASNPVFTLVSLTATTAKVGIAGGSLASGKQTVTLKKNKPTTLLNTADGTRYVLRLLSLS